MSTKTELCPYCGQPITPKKLQEIEATISAQKEKEYNSLLEEQKQNIKEKVEKELRPRLLVVEKELDGYRKRETELFKREEEIRQEKDKMALEIHKQVAKQIEEVAAKVRKEEAEKLESERKEWLATKNNLEGYKRREKELLDREVSLKQKKDDLDLEVKKQIAEGYEKIAAEVRKQEAERYDMERREREKKETELKQKLVEMEAKLANGSRQVQGHLQEDKIEELLKNLFPTDSIGRIAKSRGGADILHAIYASDEEVGKIYWESKRTEKWSEGWLDKLREDQRKAKADIAVLVSVTLPNDQPRGGLREGVLVIHPDQIEVVAPILRDALLNIHKGKIQGQHLDHKAQRLLEYFGGKEFNLLLAGIIEDINAFRDLDEKEERVITNILAQRRELRAKSTHRITSLYGTVRGIMGTLPEVKGLELPAPPQP